MSCPMGHHIGAPSLNAFETLGIGKKLAGKLADQGLSEPTPIQSEAIPIILSGRDVMGLAQTGTGKTLAFGLPIIDALLSKGSAPQSKTVRALVLAPTRELAKQIQVNLKLFQGGGHLKINMVVGGVSLGPQRKALARGTDILVATPGRLIDLLEQEALTLAQTHHLVLDEADQMLDMGFIHALRQIAKLLPSDRQTLLFSATMPKLMEELAATYLNHPRKVQVSPPGKAADKITQSVHYVAKAAKAELLVELLGAHRGDLSLIFTRTKHGAEKLRKLLESKDIPAGSIHGNKSQNQRDRALEAFKSGQIAVLVATDVAARGIDIPDVGFVYNFDLPNVPENYVHRIGRTARAGKDGAAITLCAPDEMGLLRDIEKLIKKEIGVASGRRWSGPEPDTSPSKAKPKKSSGRRRKSAKSRTSQAAKGQGNAAPKDPANKTAANKKPADKKPVTKTPENKPPGAANPSGPNKGPTKRRRVRRRRGQGKGQGPDATPRRG